MSITGERDERYLLLDPRDGNQKSRNGIWEFKMAESTLMQLPLRCIDDGKTYVTQYGSDPFTFCLYDTKAIQRIWFLFDPVTRIPKELPSTDFPNGGDRSGAPTR